MKLIDDSIYAPYDAFIIDNNGNKILFTSVDEEIAKNHNLIDDSSGCSIGSYIYMLNRHKDSQPAPGFSYHAHSGRADHPDYVTVEYNDNFNFDIIPVIWESDPESAYSIYHDDYREYVEIYNYL